MKSWKLWDAGRDPTPANRRIKRTCNLNLQRTWELYPFFLYIFLVSQYSKVESTTNRTANRKLFHYSADISGEIGNRTGQNRVEQNKISKQFPVTTLFSFPTTRRFCRLCLLLHPASIHGCCFCTWNYCWKISFCLVLDFIVAIIKILTDRYTNPEFTKYK